MRGNSFGRVFRISTWGESHGSSVGVVVDGCPSGISLCDKDFETDLQMRQGGNAPHTTPRKESDTVHIESGVFEGKTIGTPITLRIVNQNQNPSDYEAFRFVPRPGHADITTYWKHGHRDFRGGGRSSARETVARVAAGVIAKKILSLREIKVLAFVRRIGPEEFIWEEKPFHAASREKILEEHWPFVENNRKKNSFLVPVEEDKEFSSLIEKLQAEKDSYGGNIECWIRGLPPGIGEPVFEKLNAKLAQALFSLPAVVGVEVGGGADMSYLPGSMIRDPIAGKEEVRVEGNKHGGLLGGMTTGEPLWLSVSFHAPTSVSKNIPSVDLKTKEPQMLSVKGRHDSIPLPRAVPMVESMVAITIVDALALQGAF